MRVLFDTFRISCINRVKERNFTNRNFTYNSPFQQQINLSSEALKANFLHSTLNFEGRIAPKKFKLIRYADEISCPCCGEKMHNFDKNKAQILTNKISTKKGKELSNALRNNIEEFQPSKRELARVIAKEADENPNLEFYEILAKISPDYTERLRMKQIAVVIDLTSELIRSFPNKEAEIEKWRYNQIKQIINAKDEGDFRNLVLIDLLMEFNKENEINLARHELEFYFSRLPNSKKDKDAFVVKYKRRSSKEGIYHLIKNTNPTIEHVKTYSNSRNNQLNNLLLMCTDCNSARGSVPYWNFVKTHPEIKENVEKYLNDIKKILRREDTPDVIKEKYRNYIQQIMKTLRIESGGRLFGEKHHQNS